MSDMYLCVINITFLDKGPFTCSVEKGECVGLTGRSGIGKTQLFRAITDLIPAGGKILLEGISCSAFTPTKWRSKVTMVPADSCWWYDRAGDHFPVADQPLFFRRIASFLVLIPRYWTGK
jgi:ABC-type bacteriocin/lantibiotic exporter with double-glycine peptidase domain